MFDIINNKLEVLPEALTYPAIRKLWERDKGKEKSVAKQQLAYLYHMHNRHSSCWNIQDTERHKEVIKLVFPEGTDWIPEKDDIYFRAMEIYKRILSYSPKHFALDCAREGLYIMGDNMKKDTTRSNDIKGLMKGLDDAFDAFDSLKKKADRDEIEIGISKLKGNLRLGKRQR